jgi:GNAT superfamily N-acetyltransferase
LRCYALVDGLRIERVGEGDLEQLLPLLRGYCDFYGVEPSDDELLALCRALIAEPEHAGVQLLARGADGEALGFATVYWTWRTLRPGRHGVMNDLFVIDRARGLGVADALIAACVERCREHGARGLGWQTAKDNHRAQSVYERAGATREEWVDYSLEL